MVFKIILAGLGVLILSALNMLFMYSAGKLNKEMEDAIRKAKGEDDEETV